MDEEHRFDANTWMYRSAVDRQFWHVWYRGVHIHWDWVVDDFGNLVDPRWA
jgi:hypothetical protein